MENAKQRHPQMRAPGAHVELKESDADRVMQPEDDGLEGTFCGDRNDPSTSSFYRPLSRRANYRHTGDTSAPESRRQHCKRLVIRLPGSYQQPTDSRIRQSGLRPRASTEKTPACNPQEPGRQARTCRWQTNRLA